MKDQNDTQAIFQKISDIKEIMMNHIIETNTYRKERDKVIDAHSDVIWDKDNQAGLATRVDRLEQIESERKWTIRAIVVAILAGFSDRIFNFFR